MIKLGNFVVILDACVIYDSFIRDLLLRIAKNELYQAKWSNLICNEVIKNLIANRATTPEKAQKLINIMNITFPEALIDNYIKLNIIDSLEINDKDKHVLSTAILSNSQVIVTYNLKDFPNKILEKYSVEAQSPDLFLQNLFDLSPDGVIDSFKELEKSLKSPPIPRNELLKKLMKQVPEFAKLLKEQLEGNIIKIY